MIDATSRGTHSKSKFSMVSLVGYPKLTLRVSDIFIEINRSWSGYRKKNPKKFCVEQNFKKSMTASRGKVYNINSCN